VASAALHLIPYAFIAAASPLGLTAALTAIRTGRVQALALGVGVVIAQLAALTLLVALGIVSAGNRPKRPDAEGAVELLLGLLLIFFALRIHRRREAVGPSARDSSQILDRLKHVHGPTAFVAGLALGVGGPKRLVITALAAASITAAGVGKAGVAGLILWYGVLATFVVWVPVAAAILVGDRAVETIKSGFAWVMQHRRPVAFWVLLVTGAYFIGHGLLLLVTHA
jgi:hypothetical protein